METQFAILLDLQKRLEALEGQPRTPSIPQSAIPEVPLAFEYERDQEGNVTGARIDEEVIQECERFTENSMSREFIARHIVRQIFSKEERGTRNCSGKSGKKALDMYRMNAVKREVFKRISAKAADKETLWKNCSEFYENVGKKCIGIHNLAHN